VVRGWALSGAPELGSRLRGWLERRPPPPGGVVEAGVDAGAFRLVAVGDLPEALGGAGVEDQRSAAPSCSIRKPWVGTRWSDGMGVKVTPSRVSGTSL